MTLTIYSKPGCHLCDEMKGTVERVRTRVAFDLNIVDISNDAELDARYGCEIPVLMIDGKKAAKFRIAEHDLARRLTSRWPSGLSILRRPHIP